MQRKDIKVGDKVAVYIEWIYGPETVLLTGTSEAAAPGMTSPYRMPGGDDDPTSTSEWVQRHFAPATVVALGSTYYRGNHNHSTYKHKRDDGIMVEFDKPCKTGRGDIKFAVVTNPRHVAGRWDDIVAEREANANAKAESLARSEREAAEFAPKLAAFQEQLASIGLDTEIHSDASGLTGDVHVQLYRAYMASDYGDARPTGFGHETRLDTALFRELVKIAAKHGEKVVVGDES